MKELDWQLGTITGTPDRGEWVKLGRGSTLLIRCQLSDLSLFDVLSNQILRVGQTLLELGEMTGNSIQPCSNLSSRIVTIGSGHYRRVTPFEFGVLLGKRLAIKGFETTPILGEPTMLCIKDKDIPGYSISFERLTPQESIALQLEGLGRRRRMGCGVFVNYC